MSDAEFDRLATRLSGEWWDDLSPLRKWQLGRNIATTGFQVKVTVAAASAAASWLRSTGEARPILRTRAWREHKTHGRYLLANEFTRGDA